MTDLEVKAAFADLKLAQAVEIFHEAGVMLKYVERRTRGGILAKWLSLHVAQRHSLIQLTRCAPHVPFLFICSVVHYASRDFIERAKHPRFDEAHRLSTEDLRRRLVEEGVLPKDATSSRAEMEKVYLRSCMHSVEDNPSRGVKR